MKKLVKGIGVIALLFVVITVETIVVDAIIPPHQDAYGNTVWIGRAAQ